jgi:protein involved in polysaccharide export with SLBB domain
MGKVPRTPVAGRPGRPRALLVLVVLLGTLPAGCAALANPLAEGVPARLVPPELLARAKCEEQTIPLNLLRQPSSPVYRLAPGDVLGIYIEGVLGERTQAIPIQVGPQVQVREQHRLPPSAGYPIPVDENGTITLPRLGTLPVQGLTLAEVREAIRKLGLEKEVLKQGNEQILVTLMHPRRYQVLVFRQEAANYTTTPQGLTLNAKRGTGYLIDLPASENDVLHALAQTGGLPGLDAYNEIIMRDCFLNDTDRAALQHQLEAMPGSPLQALPRTSQVVHIPLRLPHGAKLPIRPEDILLGNGDVVFMEARDEEVFYTGGLLPPGIFVLPRDRDLDVVEAIAFARGPRYHGDFGGSTLSGNLVNPGVGNPSATLLTVLRRTPRCGQVPIIVDLNAAMRHPQERILVQAGDVLILQEKPGEALGRWFYQSFFNFNIFWNAIKTKNAAGVFDIASPDRIPGRVGTVVIQPGQ